MIIYEKLWEKMKEEKVSQYRLHKEGIGNLTVDSQGLARVARQLSGEMS